MPAYFPEKGSSQPGYFPEKGCQQPSLFFALENEGNREKEKKRYVMRGKVALYGAKSKTILPLVPPALPPL
jgi:hypothetical protein